MTEEDEPVVGVVYEVTRDEMFYAWRGSYAYLNGERIVVSQTDRLENSLIAIGFAYGTVSKTDGFIDSLIRFQNTTNGRAPSGVGGCRFGLRGLRSLRRFLP